MSYFFLQCRLERCRFRFPASAEESQALVCPRCGGEVEVVAETLKSNHARARSVLEALTLVGLLDNIRSIHNVGSMFRSADGAGVGHLYLAGITATPEHPKLAKAALGANEDVPWSYYANGLDAVADLRANDFHLWALENVDDRKSTSSPPSGFPQKLALVVGNERAGIDPAIQRECDALLSLPMSGRKSSLNVAVAFGIALYWVRYGKLLAPIPNRESGDQHDDDGQAGEHADRDHLGRRVG